jgi:hypothetical protein
MSTNTTGLDWSSAPLAPHLKPFKSLRFRQASNRVLTFITCPRRQVITTQSALLAIAITLAAAAEQNKHEIVNILLDRGVIRNCSL